jgi:hypothetical protein
MVLSLAQANMNGSASGAEFSEAGFPVLPSQRMVDLPVPRSPNTRAQSELTSRFPSRIRLSEALSRLPSSFEGTWNCDRCSSLLSEMCRLNFSKARSWGSRLLTVSPWQFFSVQPYTHKTRGLRCKLTDPETGLVPKISKTVPTLGVAYATNNSGQITGDLSLRQQSIFLHLR